MDDTDWSADDALLARILKGYWIVKHQKNGTPNYFVLSKNAHGFTFEQVAYDSIVFNQVDFDNIESIAKKLTNRACGSFNSPGIMISLEFDGYKDIDDPAIQPADAMLSALRNAKYNVLGWAHMYYDSMATGLWVLDVQVNGKNGKSK